MVNSDNINGNGERNGIDPNQIENINRDCKITSNHSFHLTRYPDNVCVVLVSRKFLSNCDAMSFSIYLGAEKLGFSFGDEAINLIPGLDIMSVFNLQTADYKAATLRNIDESEFIKLVNLCELLDSNNPFIV
ncbi:MAG: hypothetical protein AAFQ80_15160 [Cyanobacteria bacterium J06621_8]